MLALLQAGFLPINQCRIQLYADMPYTSGNIIMSERVLVKDSPLWTSDDLINEYIGSQANMLMLVQLHLIGSQAITGDHHLHSPPSRLLLNPGRNGEDPPRFIVIYQVES